MLKKSVLLAALVSLNCFAQQVPSQFVAKMYTEALGRAPDEAGWKANLNYAKNNGMCSVPILQTIAVGVYGSGEYTAKAYTPEEQVLTLYRGVFSREPDPSGLGFWSGHIRNGMSATQVVGYLMASDEFIALKNEICTGKNYQLNGAAKQAISLNLSAPPGGPDPTIVSQATLESCLNGASSVCTLAPRSLVYLTRTLTIPANKTLTTQGEVERGMYARQARLVRAAVFPGNMIVMQSGSTLRNVWVSGQRHLFKQGLKKSVNGAQEDVAANIDYVGGSGVGTITGVRSDAPLVATHIATFPVPSPQTLPTSSGTFSGNANISNNLMTGYANSHTYAADGAAPDAPVVWTDGISHHLNNGTINNNHIVDPSDVGIVLFGHDNSTQMSSASGNMVVHAGVDAYGSMGLDTIQCLLSFNNCTFSSTAGLSSNIIFSGPLQHSDVMLFNGTGAWSGATCAGSSVYPSPTPDRCGLYGRISNNRTIGADMPVMVQAALAIDGMKLASADGNALDTVFVNGYTVPMRCFRGALYVSADSGGHASGAYSRSGFVDAHMHDANNVPCIGH